MKLIRAIATLMSCANHWRSVMSKFMGWVVAIVAGSGALLGCENTPRALSAGDQAAAQRARCAEFSDTVIARVLDGSNVERVEPLYTGYASKSSNPRLQG